MTKIQREFINLYSFQKKNYPEIENELNIDRKQLQKIRKEVNESVKNIQYIYSKFKDERKKAFNSFEEFYDWYVKQDQKCGYCGISQEELSELFDKDNRILPYLDTSRHYEKLPKRSTGTLEIEKLESQYGYSEENIILACPLCNNAKSNLIDEDSWRKLFVIPMRNYYESLLKTKLKNKISINTY